MLDPGDEELTRVALEDSPEPVSDAQQHAPTLWRVVALVLIAVLALATVFWTKL